MFSTNLLTLPSTIMCIVIFQFTNQPAHIVSFTTWLFVKSSKSKSLNTLSFPIQPCLRFLRCLQLILQTFTLRRC
ncbi:hypothetical protein DF16_pBMB2062orf00003 (plasmid) [Bacillus thuringiensis serovar kurstaki str. YBT-1520]|nr:hypothetical protein DF16_pBMB2062orf00003 [Bacillus thuringiensis serovar kurstaki str. YBT-1520]